MDTLVPCVTRSTYHVHYGPGFKDISLRRRYYIRGLCGHSVLGCIMHDPVFAACFCTAMEFDASDVLSDIVYEDATDSMVSAYMFYVGTLLSTSSSSLRSAHACCIRHTIRAVHHPLPTVYRIINLADGFGPYNYNHQSRIYGRTSCDWVCFYK